MCVRLYVRVCVRVSMAVTSMRRRSGARTLGCEVQNHVGQVGALPRSSWERTCDVWVGALVEKRGQQVPSTTEANTGMTFVQGIEPHATTRGHTTGWPHICHHLPPLALDYRPPITAPKPAAPHLHDPSPVPTSSTLPLQNTNCCHRSTAIYGVRWQMSLLTPTGPIFSHLPPAKRILQPIKSYHTLIHAYGTRTRQ